MLSEECALLCVEWSGMMEARCNLRRGDGQGNWKDGTCCGSSAPRLVEESLHAEGA